MIHRHLNLALAAAAVLLLASAATAQSPHAAAPAKANAAHPAQNAADKTKSDEKSKGDPKEALGKADKPKLDGKEGNAANAKAADPAAREAERDARRAAQHQGQRDHLRSLLRAPMTEALKQELRRHAHRVARIERIKALAVELKDKDTGERADKLLASENARHEKWMTTFKATSDNIPKTDQKGGVQ